MNLYQLLEETVQALRQQCPETEFRMAYSGTPCSRLPERPMVVFDAEYRREEGEPQATVQFDLCLPPELPAGGEKAEELLRPVLEEIDRRFPAVTEVSRGAAEAGLTGTVIRCRAAVSGFGEGARLLIGGNPCDAAGFSVTEERSVRAVCPIGDTETRLIPGKVLYRGEIRWCPLIAGEQLRDFSLQAGNIRYEHCHWVSLERSREGLVRKAEFLSTGKTVIGEDTP